MNGMRSFSFNNHILRRPCVYCASHRVAFNSNVMIQQQGSKVQEEAHAYSYLHTHKHVLVPRVTLSLFCLCVYLQVHIYSRLQRVDEWLHSQKKAPGETFQLLQNTKTYRELQSFRENIVAYGCACVQHRAVACLRNNKELLPKEEQILRGLGYSLEMYLCSL